MRRLLIRPGAIGDTILTLPAFEHLCGGAAETEIWVRTDVIPLMRHLPATVRSLASSRIDMLEIDPPAGLRETLESFDEIWSWYGTQRAAFRECVRDLPVTFLDALPPQDGDVHAADFFARQVGAPTPAVPKIPIRGPRHGAVLIHPYSGSPKKNWPLEKWQALSQRMPVEWAHERTEDLGDLASWIAGASVYAGNDSGITHMAAAVGTPVVAVFGPMKPQVWAPRGAPLRVLANPDMSRIAVGDVVAAIEALRGSGGDVEALLAL